VQKHIEKLLRFPKDWLCDSAGFEPYFTSLYWYYPTGFWYCSDI